MRLIQSNWRSPDERTELIARPFGGASAYQSPEQPAQYESVAELLAVLKKYWKTVAGIALGVFLLVLLACLLVTSKYDSTATIEVNRDAAAAPDATGGPGNLTTQVDDVITEVGTDTSILEDSSLALEVIRRLDLAKQHQYAKVVPKEEKGLALEQAPITREKYIKVFEKSLKVEPVTGTRLIQVTFRNPDPVVAANAANTLSQLFISDYLQRKITSTSEVSFWIGKQLDTLKKQVEQSEQALADYEHKTGLAGIDMATDTAGNSMAMQAHNVVLDRLNTLNTELTAAEASRISSETVYKLIQTQDPEVVLGLTSMGVANGGTVLAQGGGLDLLNTLRAQELPLKTQYADLSTKYGAKNPRLIQLQNQIDALDAEIKGELNKISKRAENDYHYAKQNEDAIKGQLNAQQGVADKQTDDTVHLQILAQQAFSNRKLYQDLFSQLNQANVTAGIRTTHLDVVDPGQVPGLPAFPNYLIALPVGAVAGILLGIIVAFIRQSMDHMVQVPEDIENAIQLPVIAHLPLFNNGKTSLPVTAGDSVLVSTPELPLSEAFRTLRTSIVLSRPAKENKVLLITSPTPGDGKSTVAFNLAVAFAQQNERVLLIDGDMRSADLHRQFGGSNERGLSEALSGQARSLDPLLTQHRVFSTLYLLPAGSKPHLPIELLSSPGFDRLLQEARASFDWILIDTPPFLPFADAAVLSTKVDAVLPVIRSGVTSKEMLVTINTLLQRMRAPVVGFVLNGVKDEVMKPYQMYGYQGKQEKAEYAQV